MKWVTRARPMVDRIACPWLIRRFVDPRAEFLYVPAEEVLAVAERESAIPYDVPNVELGHHGRECSFDAIIKKYNLTDPALATTRVPVSAIQGPGDYDFGAPGVWGAVAPMMIEAGIPIVGDQRDGLTLQSAP